MTNNDDKRQRSAVAELRRSAEAWLQANTVELPTPRSLQESQRLVHELEVHRIELELQNTELRQARDELEKSLAKYTDLYEFAPVGYVTLDRDGRVGAVNLRGASLLGGERAQLFGRRFELFVAVEDRQLFAQFLAQVFADRVKGACEVTLIQGKDPRRVVQLEGMACESGQECRLAVIDMTARRHAEEALVEKHRELAELNAVLEARVAQAVDDMRQKDRLLMVQGRQAVMGEMIDNIAHQWRQPLNSLALIVQHVQFSCAAHEQTQTSLNAYIDQALNLILHMSETIEDFRNFFRTDKEKVAFALNGVIEKTLALVKENFKEQNIDIAHQTVDNPILIGYPNEYAQVLMNLLCNARDALVAHQALARRISVQAFMEGELTVVTISDNAGGIAEGIMDRLFDPDFTTKGPDQGTGIGLFMSRTIVEKHMGGRLTVRNTGDGAEFRIAV